MQNVLFIQIYLDICMTAFNILAFQHIFGGAETNQSNHN
jgi:hypothetical protein